ncbi:MAG: tetratricopeptide repeat protein, partial [Deltaproteobacteria bacterium]|nr:tetratricopeptide repeat protein [Deltaproteobacteria bacterium]
SRHRYRDAAVAYGKAADQARGECEPLFYRGLVRLLMGDPQGAEQDFNRCLELGDKSHQVYGGLGYARFDQSRFEDAVAAFKKALGINPGTADNHIGMALALFRLGRNDESRAAFEKAVKLEPSMKSGYQEAEKKGYIYSEVEKKAWEDMLSAFQRQR